MKNVVVTKDRYDSFAEYHFDSRWGAKDFAQSAMSASNIKSVRVEMQLDEEE